MRIASEGDAWRILGQALRDELPQGFIRDLELEHWPRYRVYVPETAIPGSISPLMMQAFLELQTGIYRTQALYSRGTTELRSLTDAERDAYQIRVKVEGGSSKYEVDLTELLKHLGTAAIAKMKPGHIIAAALGVGLIWSGEALTSQWLRQMHEEHTTQQHGEEHKQFFDALAEAGHRDTEHEKLWAEAVKEVGDLKKVQQAVEPARRQTLRALADEPKGGSINGIEVPAVVAREALVTARQRSADTSRRQVYQVARVDTLTPEGFRVTFRNPHTGEMVTASLQDALVSDRHRAVIQAAEWKKTYVLAEIRGRELRGRLIDPVVVDVREATADEARAADQARGVGQG